MNKQELELQVKQMLIDMSIEDWTIEDLKSDDRVKQELCYDSLDTVEIIMNLEKEFDISIEDEECEQLSTVQDYIDIVAEKLNITE